MTGKPTIVVVGEAMVELSGTGRQARMGFGGDTLNTAIHLARFGLSTAYFTALGTDSFSDQMRAEFEWEGLDTRLVVTDPDRHPGLYAITTDHLGERSFLYWRDRSAARRMFSLKGSAEAVDRAQGAKLLYFSLISLAILPRQGREQLLGVARRVREQGGEVAFDGNYRARLWPNAKEAARVRDAAIALCDIGLPTLADEQQLSGFGSAGSVADHWRSLGAREVVVKMGSGGAWADGRVIAPPAALSPVDTTGAGDAFNAAYLAARLRGAEPSRAALLGHRLGGWVVMRSGAVPPIDEAAPYEQ